MNSITRYDTAPAAPSPYATPAEVRDAARTARHLLVLDEMMEVGADLVRRTQAAVQEASDPVKVAEYAASCERLVQSLQRTVALAARVARARRQDVADRRAPEVEAGAASAPAQVQAARHFWRARTVHQAASD